MIPTEDTRRDMLRYGLLLKQSDQGFMVLFETSFAGRNRDISEVLPSISALRFLLVCTDPDFWNYTGNLTGFQPGKSVLYFSTLYQNDDELRFHRAETIGSAEIRNDLSEIRIPGSFQLPTAIFDLVPCKMLFNGRILIRFAPKCCFWRYLITNEALLQLENPGILNKGSNTFFLGPDLIQLADDRPALVFTSPRPLPILEYPTLSHQLMEHSGSDSNAQRMVLSALPGPDVRRHLRADNQTAGSELIKYADIIL